MSKKISVVVLGAGVLGLTVALQLTRQGYKNVAVVTKHMPGDRDPEYTSPWAGVDWVPISTEGSEEAEWDAESWEELKKLAENSPEAGVRIQGRVIRPSSQLHDVNLLTIALLTEDRTAYYKNDFLTSDQFRPWFKDFVPNFKILNADEVPEFADWGAFYRTIALDPSVYLHYLQSTCISKGVVFIRNTVKHIHDAFQSKPGSTADVVVNCSGLLASKLGGVEDARVTPARGQMVIVEKESHGVYAFSGDPSMNNGVDRCYIINRPFGGGTALGGSFHTTWDTEPDMELARRIMERSIKICPRLVPPGGGIDDLRVVRHQVGLRPVREGGPRIEAETIDGQDGERLYIVHCYGAGGFGFQASYGMASKAVKLVAEVIAAT